MGDMRIYSKFYNIYGEHVQVSLDLSSSNIHQISHAHENIDHVP